MQASISVNGSRHTQMFTHILSHTQMSTHRNSHMYTAHNYTYTLRLSEYSPSFVHMCICYDPLPPSISHTPLNTRAHPWLLRALFLSEAAHYRSSALSLFREETQRVLVAHVSSCGYMNRDM